MPIKKKAAPSQDAIVEFQKFVDFNLPKGFIDFVSENDNAELFNDHLYIIFWPLKDMIELNKNYHVDEYASNYFVFGSNGADTAYCIKKATGEIFEMPFVGMSNNEARFTAKSLTSLLEDIGE